MEKMRCRLSAKRGFSGWSRRFSESFNETTCLEDISAETLQFLIQQGDDTSTAIYDLVMGIESLGPGSRFPFLEAAQKMAVTDVTLFLLDQFRFEAMRRLGWVDTFHTSHIPLVTIVEEFSTRFSLMKQTTPPLSPRHPAFREYMATFAGDRGGFIRRLIPKVLETFGKKDQETR
jgi:hypothetical protein